MPGSRDDVNPPQIMTQHDKLRLRNASFRVQRVLPPYIAKLLQREFLSWEEFGYYLGSGSFVKGAVDEIMKMPLPDISPSPPTPVTPPASSHLKSAVGYE
jgi:hypothetical protein